MAPVVEIFPDGVWIDITGHIRYESGLTTEHGEGAQSDTAASICTFVLDNRSNTYSSDVPGTPYYRKLGRGTPIRITEAAAPEFYGEIWSLTPMADESGNDITSTVEAAGILRRLSNTDKPIRSALYRSISTGSPSSAPPFAYWPLEDGSDSVDLEQTVAGVRPGQPVGAVSLGSDSTLPGAAPLPSLSPGGYVAGYIPPPNLGVTQWSFSWLMRIDAPPTALSVIADIRSAGLVSAYTLLMAPDGTLTFRGGSPSFAFFGNIFEESDAYDAVGVSFGEPSLYGRWVEWTMYNTDFGGGNFSVVLQWTSAEYNGAATSISAPANPGSFSAPRGLWQIFGPAEGSEPLSVGHVSVWEDLVMLAAGATTGYRGETAGDRIERLCGEEGIAVSVTGGGSIEMGPQPRGTVLSILQDCSAADLGILREPRDSFGLEYRSRKSLYNQVPSAVIDVSAGQLESGLAPARDDTRGLANQVESTRDGGTTQVFTVEDGDVFHLTTEDPPDGIGLVPTQISPNVETDQHAAAEAAWHTHLRSWREPRYESLVVELNAPAYRANPALAVAVAGLDLGDCVQLTNQPAWVPPDPIELHVRGIKRYWTAKWNGSAYVDVQRQIELNTVPAVPWEVWCVNSGGSTIVVARNTVQTSLKLATSLGPEWVDNPDPGFLIQANGEAMGVTGMSVDTPAFIAAGTASNASNASVTPGLPAGMTVDTGQLMVCVAAIRNSGTGTVNVPAGWTDIANFGNMRVFGRHYVTGDSAPTVTFTGGVANADTSARIAGFSGVSLNLDHEAQTQLNSSAANVAYPGITVKTASAAGIRRDKLVMLIAAWKQDDTSGVTAASGFTEAFESSTTTGDDQSIALDYRLDTFATAVTAGSKTWAGGASAISRTVVVALRPLQTATVTRSINGVVQSIAAGEAVHVWRHGAVPL